MGRKTKLKKGPVASEKLLDELIRFNFLEGSDNEKHCRRIIDHEPDLRSLIYCEIRRNASKPSTEPVMKLVFHAALGHANYKLATKFERGKHYFDLDTIQKSIANLRISLSLLEKHPEILISEDSRSVQFSSKKLQNKCETELTYLLFWCGDNIPEAKALFYRYAERRGEEDPNEMADEERIAFLTNKISRYGYRKLTTNILTKLYCTGNELEFKDPFVKFSAILFQMSYHNEVNNYDQVIDMFHTSAPALKDLFGANNNGADAIKTSHLLCCILLYARRCYACKGNFEQAVKCEQLYYGAYGVKDNLVMTNAELLADGSLALEDYNRAAKEYKQVLSSPENFIELSIERQRLLRKLGWAHFKRGSWNEATKALEKSIKVMKLPNTPGYLHSEEVRRCRQMLGHVYLEQFCSDNALVEMSEIQRRILIKALDNSQKAATKPNESLERVPNFHSIHLDLAQEYYLLGMRDDANRSLMAFLDFEQDTELLSCNFCRQACNPSICANKKNCCEEAKNPLSSKVVFEDSVHKPMQVCSQCKVVSYCCTAHQRRDWKEGRVRHRHLCPLLKRWRVLNKKKGEKKNCEELFDSFFESIFKRDCKQ